MDEPSRDAHPVMSRPETVRSHSLRDEVERATERLRPMSADITLHRRATAERPMRSTLEDT